MAKDRDGMLKDIANQGNLGNKKERHFQKYSTTREDQGCHESTTKKENTRKNTFMAKAWAILWNAIECPWRFGIDLNQVNYRANQHGANDDSGEEDNGTDSDDQTAAYQEHQGEDSGFFEFLSV